MRILAIDYGDQRIGLALSDASAMLCGRAWTVHEWNLDRAVEAIAVAARENEVGLLVLGLPKNMDGTEGPRAEKSRMVASLLEETTGLEVRLWDERRSSIEAHAILHANGKKEKKHRQTVDAVAASLILEGFLGAHGSEYRA
jgi:putative Holliday junction resolvase